MANRLTDTTIWKKQKWFKKLSVVHKLAWKYLTDECDHAGIWKIDISELLEDLGLDEFDFPHFLECCNKDFDKKTGKGMVRQRIMHFDEDHVWITGFMTFQYGGKTKILSQKNNAVPSAISVLQAYNLFDLGLEMRYFKISNSTEAPESPLQKAATPLEENATPFAKTQSQSFTPLKSPLGTKDKDKDKDKLELLNNKIKKEIDFLIFQNSKNRVGANELADHFSNWLTSLGISNKREFTVENDGERNDRFDLIVFDDDNNWAFIIEVKNYKRHDDYYKELKQIERYKKHAKPILFVASVNTALDCLQDAISFQLTGKQGKNFIQEKKFNTMPKAEDFDELPPIYVGKAIELVHLTSRVKIDEQTVISFWEIFKIQELTGQQYYPNTGKVYSHFLNVIKKQKIENGSIKTTVSGQHKSGLDAIFEKGQQKFNAARGGSNSG